MRTESPATVFLALLLTLSSRAHAAGQGTATSTDTDAGKAAPEVVDNSDCLACHADPSLEAPAAPGGKPRSLAVDEERFSASAHGHNRCTSCHADITDNPHPDGFRAKPVVCSQCHRVETDIYRASDHGLALHRGVDEAASCKDCHGASHTILNSRNPASPVNRSNIPATCANCHSRLAEMQRFDLRQHDPVSSYESSVHGQAVQQKGVSNAAVCTDCHGSHGLLRSNNPKSKLYFRNVPSTCGRCHENIEHTYLRSVHGKALAKGTRDVPVCVDCHGEHSIASVGSPQSRVSPASVPDTCAQCHSAPRIITQYRLAPDVVSTYASSFHGLALKGGNPMVANCASCHGAHDILPSSDPLSSVNPKALPQTCGKCHPGIGTRLGAEFFKVHAPMGPHRDQHRAINVVSKAYLLLIVFTIGGMALFVLLDYGRKTRDHIRTSRSRPHAELRFSPWLKWQHLTLMILFIGLAYTGFVHRFPDAFFSAPFRLLDDGNALRSLLHRVFGWTFVVLFFAHMVVLLGTRAGRAHARVLMLAKHDVKDALVQVLFNLGIGAEPAPRRRWNYAEKAEYWALVWGSLVMGITGVMMVFSEAMLRSLPKVWNDLAQVIHYYEAVLATLAILIWHLYWVIFDPAEYPMNPAWLTGNRPGHDPSVEEKTPPTAAAGSSEPDPAPPSDEPKPEGG